MLNKSFVTLVAIFGFNICFAQTSIDSNNNDEALEAIIANESCIEAIQDNKIYLKSERLFPTNEGLFLDLNGQDFALLNTLNSDSRGCYVASSETLVNIYNTCPDCGAAYIITCPNKNCPSKIRKAQYDAEKKEKKEKYKQEQEEKKKKK